MKAVRREATEFFLLKMRYNVTNNFQLKFICKTRIYFIAVFLQAWDVDKLMASYKGQCKQ